MEMVPPNYVKIIGCYVSADIKKKNKKILAPKLKPLKIFFGGSPRG